MNTKLVATALVTASLVAAPVIAYAQSESSKTTTSTSTEAKPQAKTTVHHRMRITHMKPGTTTGLSSKPTKKPSSSSTKSSGY